MAYQDNNPKTAIGATKVPLHLVPSSATYYLALAFEDGARKYGPYNWRHDPVSVTTYVGAARRHIDLFMDGEDLSQDAKLHHLAHAMAGFAIVLDADAVGTLIDDRPPIGAAARLHGEYRASKFADAVIPHALAAEILRDRVMSDDDAPAPYDAHPFNPPNTQTGD